MNIFARRAADYVGWALARAYPVSGTWLGVYRKLWIATRGCCFVQGYLCSLPKDFQTVFRNPSQVKPPIHHPLSDYGQFCRKDVCVQDVKLRSGEHVKHILPEATCFMVLADLTDLLKEPQEPLVSEPRSGDGSRTQLGSDCNTVAHPCLDPTRHMLF